MNWDTIDAEWRQLKSRLRRLWGKLIGAAEESPKGPVQTPNQGVVT
jgi:uncharacterized protein YjbJ (UPF0337 family)